MDCYDPNDPKHGQRALWSFLAAILGIILIGLFSK